MANAVDDDRAFDTGVLGDFANRRFERAFDALDAVLFVADRFDVGQRVRRAEQRDAAARNDAFIQRRLRRRLRVFEEVFAFFQLRFGRRADVDASDAAGQFREAFLELFFVVRAGRRFDFGANLRDASFDFVFFAAAVDDRRRIAGNDDFLRFAEVGDFDRVELDAEVFIDGGRAGQDGDIAEHRLAAFAVTRRFDRANLEDAAHLVDDERRERFAFDVFGDDEERLALFADRFEERNQRFDRRNFFFEDENERVFKFDFLVVGVRNEVRGEVAAVELHPFDDVDVSLGLFPFFDGDNAVFTDFNERVGQDLTDRRIVVPGDRRDLRDFFAALVADRGREFVDVFADEGRRFLNPARKSHRVGARGDHFEAFEVDRFGQNGRGGGAVAGDGVRFRRGFLHQLRAQIFFRVFERDVFGDGNAVFGNFRGAPTFIQNDVATAGAQGAFHGASQFGDALGDRPARGVIERHFLCHCGILL